ncbi:type VI secretion system protein, partial [Burkholderia pseudomallei]|uniref:type VI secretion system protein n=1 Tax=Burkholderia pseudomallei TaxID=28450 RepID=UPI0021F71014
MLFLQAGVHARGEPRGQRAQAWGFTLPYDKETIADEGVHARCADELRALAARLAAGLNTRLQEEHDTQRRRRPAAPPAEYPVLTRPLGAPAATVFADSRAADTPPPPPTP